MVDPSVSSWIDEVIVDEAMRHTSEIARWVRLSGTDDERNAFEYVAETLRGYGLSTRIHEPTCLVSLPVAGSLVIAGEHFLPCITHSFSISTSESGITGELVYAGQGTRLDFAAAGARGKIALTEGLGTPNKAHAASQEGVLAVISISGEHVHEMIVSPVWGSPTPDLLQELPTVAMVSIDRAAGERIRSLMANGPIRAQVGTVVDTAWRPIPVLLADLGLERREYVLFSGHIDSWHYGAMDNASANATMMETARVLASHSDELRRGVRFAFWSGHSHARYAGSTWFADHYWFDLHERCVAHVNVDSTGAIGATDLSGANTMAETFPLARDIIGKQTDQELTYRRFGRAGDQSFWGIGLPSFFMSLSEQGTANEMTEDQAFLFGGSTARGGGLGWWWHTTEDTLDKIDPVHLERDIKVYVETVARLATDPIVPLDIVAAIDEIDAELSVVQRLWDGLPIGAEDDDVGFSELRSDLANARSSAVRVMARASSSPLPDTVAERISGAIRASCRALVPVNYTMSGEFEHDLALGASTLPLLRPSKALTAMTDDELWGATHLLRRRINRVRAAVRRAATALDETFES
jgi:hypothetical protein